MSARDGKPPFRWSKTKAQCPYCDGWMTRQGLNGHIRFRHTLRWGFERAYYELVKAGDYGAAFVKDHLHPTELEIKVVMARYRLLQTRRAAQPEDS